MTALHQDITPDHCCCCSTLHGLKVEARFLGYILWMGSLQRESVGRGSPSLSIYVLRQAASTYYSFSLFMCWRRGTCLTCPVHHFPRFRYHVFLRAERCIVDHVEGVGFRPRAVVVGREVVSGCTRISSKEYVHEK